MKKYFIIGIIIAVIIIVPIIIMTAVEPHNFNVILDNRDCESALEITENQLSKINAELAFGITALQASCIFKTEIKNIEILDEVQDNTEIQDNIAIQNNAGKSDINTIVQNRDCDAMVALSFGEFLSASKQYQQELVIFLEDNCKDAVPAGIIPPDFDDILNRSDCDAIRAMTFAELSKATSIQQGQIANIVLGVSSIRC